MNTVEAHRIYANRRWRRARLYVLQRDGYRCQIQGPHCQHTATAVDHITTLAQGGAPYDPTNLRAACQPCNSGRNQVRTRAQPSRQW